MHVCACTHARTGALPREEPFDGAGPVFYAFWDVCGMAKWRQDLFPKHTTLKPKSDMKPQVSLASKILLEP